MRESLNARRDALSVLSELATSLLRDAGHNPTADTIHRINTTLEAISAYTSPTEGPTLGRLTHDVDPPGFESLASFVPGKRASEGTSASARVSSSPKSGFEATATATRPKPTPARDDRQLKETRQERIAAAKASLQAAKKSLSDARARAQRLEAAQKKADAEAKEADKEKREAEARFRKASAASTAAGPAFRKCRSGPNKTTGTRSTKHRQRTVHSEFRHEHQSSVRSEFHNTIQRGGQIGAGNNAAFFPN